MKTLVKKHMIGLFALVLTVATMSFKMVEKNTSLSGSWYNVSSSSIDEGSGSGNPPAECSGDSETCALNIEMTDPSAPFPGTVGDAYSLQAQGKLVIHGEVFRD